MTEHYNTQSESRVKGYQLIKAFLELHLLKSIRCNVLI
jgi:hypothetical protein